MGSLKQVYQLVEGYIELRSYRAEIYLYTKLYIIENSYKSRVVT